jgi:rSAM/selenodomain-associated transferase 1
VHPHFLGVMAKFWEPGRVKTRLAAAVGDEAAATLAAGFFQTTVGRLAEIDADRVVAFAPEHRRGEFERRAGPAWRLLPQAGGDLGERLEKLFDAAFAAGSARAVVVGSDSPHLPLECVAAAFRRLAECDVVLGPAVDGGYYLVGAARRTPPIFRGMPWSQPQLCDATCQALAAARLSWQTLESGYDIDHVGDLERLREELARRRGCEPSLGALADLVERSLRG